MVTPNDEITQEQESLDQAQGVDTGSQEPEWVSRQDFEALQRQMQNAVNQVKGLQSRLDKTFQEQERHRQEQRKAELKAQIQKLPEDQQGIYQNMLDEIDRLGQGQPRQQAESPVSVPQRSEEEIAVAQKYGVDPNDPRIDWEAYKRSAVDSDAFVQFTDSVYTIRQAGNQGQQPTQPQQQRQSQPQAQRNGVQPQPQSRPIANTPGTGAPGMEYQSPDELVGAFNRGEKDLEETKKIAAQNGWRLPLV